MSDKKKKKHKVPKRVLEKRASKMRQAAWSLAVRTRDCVKGVFTCVLCGSHEYVQAHHWYVSKRSCAAAAQDPDNGISLCLRCHKLWAHKQGTYLTHSRIRQAALRIIGKAAYNALVNKVKQAEMPVGYPKP